jgi:hypothetical protein
MPYNEKTALKRIKKQFSEIEDAIIAKDFMNADILLETLSHGAFIDVVSLSYRGIEEPLRTHSEGLLELIEDYTFDTDKVEFDWVWLESIQRRLTNILALTSVNHVPPQTSDNHVLALLLDKGTDRIVVQVLNHIATVDVRDNERVIMPTAHKVLLPEDVFLPEDIEQFEDLINTKGLDEEVYQKFFEANPKWLYMIGHYESYKSQVVLPKLNVNTELVLLNPVDAITLKPDFFLRKCDLKTWDILDIKRPDAKIKAGRRQRRRFSAEVSSAIKQLKTYSERVVQNEIREVLRKKHNITVAVPALLVVIGKSDFDNPYERSQFREQEGVQVYTYDDLHRLARRKTLKLD